MASGSEDSDGTCKRTYAGVVRGSEGSENSPLSNTWWRRFQEYGEDEAIAIAIQNSLKEGMVIMTYSFSKILKAED